MENTLSKICHETGLCIEPYVMGQYQCGMPRMRFCKPLGEMVYTDGWEWKVVADSPVLALQAALERLKGLGRVGVGVEDLGS